MDANQVNSGVPLAMRRLRTEVAIQADELDDYVKGLTGDITTVLDALSLIAGAHQEWGNTGDHASAFREIREALS